MIKCDGCGNNFDANEMYGTYFDHFSKRKTNKDKYYCCVCLDVLESFDSRIEKFHEQRDNELQTIYLDFLSECKRESDAILQHLPTQT